MRDFFKFFFGLLVYVVTLTVVVAAAVFWWGSTSFTNPGPHDQPTEITVARGANIGGVADTLREAGLIESPMLFIAIGRITDQASKIKAGEYEIPAYASMKDILTLLEQGKIILRNVTIPEGRTSFEVVQILAGEQQLNQLPVETIPAEGSLLPETYSFSKSESNVDVLNRMRDAMSAALDELWAGRAQGLPLDTKEQALVLASIVEKETGVASERARIAGVFINRLKMGMPLQTDPTVIYALTQGRPKNDGQGPLGRRLLRTDLEIDSPYNTYKYAGLPPTPIANPGRAAIEATLHPEAHDFIYFVADGTGGHIFSKTLDEHNANVANWRKIRNSARP